MNNLGFLLMQQAAANPGNDVLARQWFEKAAAAGLPLAMQNLGECYERGVGGLAKDERAAIEWYEKSAKLGCATAQEELNRLRAGPTNT